jgi:acyl-coenzyme A thioesterase 13
MSSDPLASVNACWARVSKGGIYKFLFSDIEIVSAEKGSMVAKLKVGPNHVNSKGGLHGSTSATIVDWWGYIVPLFCSQLLLTDDLRAGGMAIATHGFEQTGLSVDIHVSYISTAKENDILTIEGKTTKVGRNLGFTTVNIFKGQEDNLTLVASGSHTKYILRETQGLKTS